ncbi:DUF177 domain-containing protein [uncultured Devosia sp.]|uniref:YceD family protein n=1 Tax=uncultured Devosia sp. TaxID=211434 RepID=UPI0035CA3AFF
MSASQPPIFEATIRFDRLPSAGRELDVAPDAEALVAIADILKVTAVSSFRAKLTAVKLRGGIRVQGRLNAQIVQPSVVTFEPVIQDIDEPVDRLFVQGSDRPHNPTLGAEIFVDLEDEDFPDHVEGNEVDLSALLMETLALAIDPYPRLADESLAALGIESADKDDGPFSGLKAFKTRTDTDET